MDAQAGLVTVYRSMETDAKEDCEVVSELLRDAGLAPVVLDDSAPGVPEGAYEVQVPQAESIRAEQIIAENPLPDDVEEVDDSGNLDFETIYHSEGNAMAEVEAMGIKNVLEANGIAAVLVGDSVLPNFPFEVKVAREHAQRAQQLIAEAEASGPADAERGELESERAATSDLQP